jgi:RecJ-like exonuclease
MARKNPPPTSPRKPANTSVAGEEDPGAALDAGDEAAAGTPGTGEAVCQRCGGSGRVIGAPCPSCGGTGKVVHGIGGG